MHILDIRQGRHGKFDLRAELLKGLRAPSMSIPSLLLWDGQGHEQFERILQDPAYYPLRAESELLQSQCDDIAARLNPNSQIIIELGAGYVPTLPFRD